MPLAVTFLAPAFGQQTFIYAIILVAIAYGGYIIWRLKERGPAPEAERENHGMRSAQLPNAAVLTEPGASNPQSRVR